MITKTSGVNHKLYSKYKFEDHIWTTPSKPVQEDLCALAQRCVKVGNDYWMRKVGTGHWMCFNESNAIREAKNTWLGATLSSGTVIDSALISTFFSGVYKFKVDMGGETMEMSEHVGSCPNLYGRLVVPMGPQFVTYRNQHYLNAWYDDMIIPDEKNLAVGKLVLLMAYGALCNGKVDKTNLEAEADRVYNMIVTNTYDDNKEFKFFVMWFAAQVQTPGINLLTNLWLLGETEGLGKGTIKDIMAIILGKAFVTKLNQLDIERGWNDHLVGIQLVEVNEFDTTKAKFWKNWFKAHTIEQDFNAVARGIGSWLVPHIGNFYFSGNATEQQISDINDRRNQFIQTSADKWWVGFATDLQLNYFKPNPEAVASGFAYILNQVVVDHSVISRAFKNDLRETIVANTQNEVEEWVENDVAIPWDEWTTASDLYEQYFAKWFQRSRIGNVIGPTQTAWGKQMGQNKRVIKKRTSSAMEYYISSVAPLEQEMPKLEDITREVQKITGSQTVTTIIDMDIKEIKFDPQPLTKMQRLRSQLSNMKLN